MMSMFSRALSALAPGRAKRAASAVPRDKLGGRLFEAAFMGRADWVGGLLAEGAPADEVQPHGMRALAGAAWLGHEDCVELLLPKCDPKAKDANGMDALMFAAVAGRVGCLRALLPLSDPLAASSGGMSALMFAISQGQEEAALMLLPVSDLAQRSQEGEDCLSLAAKQPAAAFEQMVRGRLALDGAKAA